MKHLALLLAFVLYLLLFWAGAPLSNYDDLFYVGAAVNWAETGVLANPWLREHFPESPLFLQYPPIYPCILGSWFRLVGISELSLRTFSLLANLVSLTCMVLLLRRALLPDWVAPYVVCAFVPAVALAGFRAEPLGWTWMLLGLLGLSYRHTITDLPGFCALGLCLLTAPALLVYACCFSGALLAVRVVDRKEEWRQEVAMLTVALAVSATVVVGLLLWSIDFQVAAFLREFLGHARFRAVRLPAVAVLGASALLVYLSRIYRASADFFRPGTRVLTVYLLASLSALTLSRLLHSRFYEGLFVLLTVSAAFYLQVPLLVGDATLPPGRAFGRLLRETPLLPGALFLYLALDASYRRGELMQIIRPPGLPPEPIRVQLQAIADEFERTGQTVCIDTYAFRYVYNCQPPRSFLDWGFQEPFPWVRPHRLKAEARNRAWITAAFSLRVLHGLDLSPGTVTYLGSYAIVVNETAGSAFHLSPQVGLPVTISQPN